MPTTPYGLNNAWDPLVPIPKEELNLWANTINMIGLRLGQLTGKGCFYATDFNFTATAGLDGTISAGVGITGSVGAEMIRVLTSVKNHTAADNATTLYYLRPTDDADGTPQFTSSSAGGAE